MTLRNWAREGSGTSSTNGPLWADRYSGLLTTSTLSSSWREQCHEAASHDKWILSQSAYCTSNTSSNLTISSVSFLSEKKWVTWFVTNSKAPVTIRDPLDF